MKPMVITDVTTGQPILIVGAFTARAVDKFELEARANNDVPNFVLGYNAIINGANTLIFVNDKVYGVKESWEDFLQVIECL